MAKVSIPKLLTGEPITETQINSFTNSLVGLNGNINDDNVSNEGIDRRNLVKQSVQRTKLTNQSHFFTGTNLIIPTGTSMQNVHTQTGRFVVVGAATQFGNALIACEVGDTILVHCSFHLDMRSGQAGTVSSPFVQPKEALPLTEVALFASNQASNPMIQIPGSFRSFRSGIVHSQGPAETKASCTIVVAWEVPENFLISPQNGMIVILRGRTSYTNVSSQTPPPSSQADSLQLFARVIKR